MALTGLLSEAISRILEDIRFHVVEEIRYSKYRRSVAFCETTNTFVIQARPEGRLAWMIAVVA